MKQPCAAGRDVHPKELEAWWQAAPQNAACMTITLRRLSVFPSKPKGMDLEAVLEGRLFWPKGELRWQRYDAFDGSNRRNHLHVMVLGSWLQDEKLNQKMELSGGEPIPGPAIWERRAVGGEDIFSVQEHSDLPALKISTKLWLDHDQRGYFQWCGLHEKVAKHDR